jgi:hypothetical protein
MTTAVFTKHYVAAAAPRQVIEIQCGPGLDHKKLSGGSSPGEETKLDDGSGELTGDTGPCSPVFILGDADRLSDLQIKDFLEAAQSAPPELQGPEAAVLLARPAFLDRFERPLLHDLKDGVAAHLNVQHLDGDEVEAFIRHQLRTDKQAVLFTAQRVALIAVTSGGDPAAVNRLARRMLEIEPDASTGRWKAKQSRPAGPLDERSGAEPHASGVGEEIAKAQTKRPRYGAVLGLASVAIGVVALWLIISTIGSHQLDALVGFVRNRMSPSVDIINAVSVEDSDRTATALLPAITETGASPDALTGPSQVAHTSPSAAAPTSPSAAVPMSPSVVTHTSPSPAAPTSPSAAAPTSPSPATPTSPSPAAPTGPSQVAPTSPTAVAHTSSSPAAPASPSPVAPTSPSAAAPTGPSPVAPAGPSPVAPTSPSPIAPTSPSPGIAAERDAAAERTTPAATPRPAAPATSLVQPPSSEPPPSPSSAPPKPAGPRLSSETAALVARGDAFLGAGDVTSARAFFERAADAGDSEAAMRMAVTFDQAFLDRVGLRGLRGDPERASLWYQRARDLNAVEPGHSPEMGAPPTR